MKLPPMNTLLAFSVAAHRLNFSRTGDELGITHAAVSSQMKKLEEWFGRRLFERSGRGIKLTAAGLELLHTVDIALDSISTVSEKIRLSRDRKSISVACLPSIATRWLVPSLTAFMQAYPRLSVELSYARAFQKFDPDQQDILITHLDTSTEKGIKIFDRTSKPVASADYVRSRGGNLAGQLEGSRLLHDTSTRPWDDWFAKAGFRPKRFSHGPVFPDFNLMFSSVLAGHGVGLCPVNVFRQEIERGDLVILSEIAVLSEEAYYLFSNDPPSPSSLAFIRWFRDRIVLPG